LEGLAVGETATVSFDYQIEDTFGQTATAVVTITIQGANDPASITGDNAGAMTEDASGDAGVLTVSDVDNGENVFQPQTVTVGTYGTFDIDASGNWSYTRTAGLQSMNAGDVLTDSFTVESADDTASEEVTITINGLNDPATISGDSSGAMTEDESGDTGVLSASDPDDGEDVFQPQTSMVGSYGTFDINASGTWTYARTSDLQSMNAGDVFTDSFAVESVDGTASEEVTITINGLNDAPVLDAIGNQSINEQVTLTFTVTASDQDLPADTLTFSLDQSSLDAGMTINASTGAFSWTPSESQGGDSYNATITVTDDGTPNLDESETITIAVNEVNVAPVLGAIGNQDVGEQAELSFTATATDQDLPADTLTFSLDATSLAAGMTIDANTGAFSWTPNESQGDAVYPVTITVTDDGAGTLTDSETFNITVAEVNVAPELGAIGAKSVNEQEELTFTATATDQDEPADTLSFSLDAAAIALGMSITSGGNFSWTPTESQ